MVCVPKVGHSCELGTRVTCCWVEEEEVGASQQGVEQRLSHAVDQPSPRDVGCPIMYDLLPGIEIESIARCQGRSKTPVTLLQQDLKQHLGTTACWVWAVGEKGIKEKRWNWIARAGIGGSLGELPGCWLHLLARRLSYQQHDTHRPCGSGPNETVGGVRMLGTFDESTRSRIATLDARSPAKATNSAPLGSKLCNVFGRRTLMLFVTALFTLGSGVCGCATNGNMLIAGRAIQGAGSGGHHGDALCPGQRLYLSS